MIKINSKFINRNNALQKSNLTHNKLNRIAFQRKDLVTADYHYEVCIKQDIKKRIFLIGI